MLETLGFWLEGVRHDYALKDGAFIDVTHYSRLAGDPPPSTHASDSA